MPNRWGFYKKKRNQKGRCQTCPKPTEANYILCLACRNRRNDRRSQINNDRRVDRIERLIKKRHLLTYRLAAAIIGISPRTVRSYVAAGLLEVSHREMGQVWLSRKAVECIKQKRWRGDGWMRRKRAKQRAEADKE